VGIPGDYFVTAGEPYVVRLAFGLRRPRHGIPGRPSATSQPATPEGRSSSPSDDRTDENDPTRAYARPDLPPLRRTDRSSRRKNR
jgi:hypothetical protein